MERSDNKEEIAKNIRLKRGKIKQKDFARLVHVHKDQLSRYERGISIPRAEIYERIMRFQKVEEKKGLGSQGEVYLVREPPGERYPERRLPENGPKRTLIDKILRVLDSGNKTIVTALESNVEAFLLGIDPQKVEVKDGD